MKNLVKDNPITVSLKGGQRGDGEWKGFDHVYTKIQSGCFEMAKNKYTRLNQDHIDSMADLGSGDEERMKYRMHWMMINGFIK